MDALAAPIATVLLTIAMTSNVHPIAKTITASLGSTQTHAAALTAKSVNLICVLVGTATLPAS